MSDSTELQEVLRHFQYAIQAAVETDLGGFEKQSNDYQTLVGLYLQDVLRELAAMEEKEVSAELQFYTQRPVQKMNGLIL